MTVVKSTVETALFTEISTETAATETVLSTKVKTIIGTTQIDVVSETVTVPVTATVVESAAPVTTTAFIYPQTLKVRQAEPSVIPEYATAACADWETYVKACGCTGVKPATVTAPAVTKIITVTASDAITTAMSTLSSTQTDVVTVTETVSSTATDIFSLTESVTATETVTASQTTTVLITTTPAALVSVQCQAPGTSFRASTPFYDSSTRWMNVVNSNIVAWQTFGGNVPPPVNAPTATWVVDNDGFLELRNVNAGQTEILVAIMATQPTGESAQVTVRARSTANAAIAAGTYVRVQACITPANELRMQARGRGNILECGNGLYLSRGVAGKDIRSDCHLLSPTVI